MQRNCLRCSSLLSSYLSIFIFSTISFHRGIRFKRSARTFFAKITLPRTLPVYCLVASLLVMPDVIVQKLNSWRGCTRKEKKLGARIRCSVRSSIINIPASASCLCLLPLRPASASCLCVLPLRPASASCLCLLPLPPASASCLINKELYILFSVP